MPAGQPCPSDRSKAEANVGWDAWNGGDLLKEISNSILRKPSEIKDPLNIKYGDPLKPRPVIQEMDKTLIEEIRTPPSGQIVQTGVLAGGAMGGGALMAQGGTAPNGGQADGTKGSHTAGTKSQDGPNVVSKGLTLTKKELANIVTE